MSHNKLRGRSLLQGWPFVFPPRSKQYGMQNCLGEEKSWGWIHGKSILYRKLHLLGSLSLLSRDGRTRSR